MTDHDGGDLQARALQQRAVQEATAAAVESIDAERGPGTWWVRRWRGKPRNSPTVRGDCLYVSPEGKRLFSLIPSDFREPWPEGRLWLFNRATRVVLAVIQPRDESDN